jgi:hypothetical protein
MILCVAALALGQAPSRNRGKITGVVLDKDGTTPVSGGEIQVEELRYENGQTHVAARHAVKTDSNGSYEFSGVGVGRMRVFVVISSRKVMSKGEKLGDEVWSTGGAVTIDFNLKTGAATVKPLN